MAPIAACSWSLRPSSPLDLVDALASCDLSAVQLALDPIRTGLWGEAETVEQLKTAGIAIVSGMMATAGEDYTSLRSIRETGGLRPDSTWDQNRDAAKANAQLAARLGLDLVTLHAGFIPHRRSDPEYTKLIDRLQEIIDIFHAQSVRIGLETGQETADALLEALEDIDRESVGVNFDPANMILYAMGDPVAALERLAPHVLQIHIKDATIAARKGEWGTEVPAGDGEVDWRRFFAVLRDRMTDCPLVVEREAGENRVEDIRQAVELINFYGKRGATL